VREHSSDRLCNCCFYDHGGPCYDVTPCTLCGHPLVWHTESFYGCDKCPCAGFTPVIPTPVEAAPQTSNVSKHAMPDVPATPTEIRQERLWRQATAPVVPDEALAAQEAAQAVPPLDLEPLCLRPLTNMVNEALVSGQTTVDLKVLARQLPRAIRPTDKEDAATVVSMVAAGFTNAGYRVEKAGDAHTLRFTRTWDVAPLQLRRCSPRNRALVAAVVLMAIGIAVFVGLAIAHVFNLILVVAPFAVGVYLLVINETFAKHELTDRSQRAVETTTGHHWQDVTIDAVWRRGRAVSGRMWTTELQRSTADRTPITGRHDGP